MKPETEVEEEEVVDTEESEVDDDEREDGSDRREGLSNPRTLHSWHTREEEDEGDVKSESGVMVGAGHTEDKGRTVDATASPTRREKTARTAGKSGADGEEDDGDEDGGVGDDADSDDVGTLISIIVRAVPARSMVLTDEREEVRDDATDVDLDDIVSFTEAVTV